MGEKSTKNIHYSLDALSRVYIPFANVSKRSFWLLAWCSSLFFALLCWDIAAAGDAGWAEAIWIPILTVVYPVLLWTGARCFKQRTLIRGLRKDNDDEEIVNRETETELVISSPIS